MRTPARTAAAVAGLVVAAASLANGSFLVADQTVPPFEFRRLPVREPRRTDRERPLDGAGGDLVDLAYRITELVLQAVVLLLLLFLAAVGAYYLVLGLRRLSRLRLAASRGGVVPSAYVDTEATGDDAEEALRRRVRRELDVLATGLAEAPDPREAVIACYVRMEAAATAAGTPRRPHETPTELVTRLLAEQRAPEADVRRLTALFEEARFSPHPVDDEMRAAARRSLAAIRDALGVPA